MRQNTKQNVGTTGYLPHSFLEHQVYRDLWPFVTCLSKDISLNSAFPRWSDWYAMGDWSDSVLFAVEILRKECFCIVKVEKCGTWKLSRNLLWWWCWSHAQEATVCVNTSWCHSPAWLGLVRCYHFLTVWCFSCFCVFCVFIRSSAEF